MMIRAAARRALPPLSAPVLALEPSPEIGEGFESRALELADPALGDLVDRHGIDDVQLLATLTLARDEMGRLQDRQMFGHGLPRHIQS
jgi:hypothetical protein